MVTRAEENARAHERIAQAIGPDERIVQTARATTPYVTPQVGTDPVLLVITDKQLLIVRVTDARPARGYRWRQIDDLKIHKKWTGGYAISFTIVLRDRKDSHTFPQGFDVGRKQADPFVDILRTHWSDRRRTL